MLENINLYPITLTRSVHKIHSGGFSADEEKELGFKEGELFEIPKELYQLITIHKKNFARNLNLYLKKIISKNSEYKKIKKSVFVHKSVKIDKQVEFNTDNGIIILEKNAHIMPFSYLVGPLRIDKDTIVNSHSHISYSYIGKYCKIGGEISNSIFENYSNKWHHGFIGDAYIGSWVNIGAGASSSNLKNTYGEIKIAEIETGEIHIGPILADHVKIAINSSIYTGKVIGVSSHAYGTITINVPSFTNYVSKNKMIILPPEIAIKIAERMEKRRDVKISEKEKEILLNAYNKTKDERKKYSVKKGKLSF